MPNQLQSKIYQDLAQALKSKDTEVLSLLRLLKTDIEYEMKKTDALELDDASVEKILGQALKKRQEAMKQYKIANRDDLFQKEEKELGIIEKFLPPPVPEAELEVIITEICKKLGNPEPNEMGKVMGACMSQLKGKRVDGNLVRQLITKKLNS